MYFDLKNGTGGNPAFERDRKAVSVVGAIVVLVVVFITGLFLYAWFNGYSPGNLLINRGGGAENLILNSYSLQTTENVTLNLKNTGTVTSTIVQYTVRDSGGDYYNGNATGPTISPNEIKSVTILIGTECGPATHCQLTGNSFTFHSGSSYTIILMTSRNNQFSFPIGS